MCNLYKDMHGRSAIEAADDTDQLISEDVYNELVSAIHSQGVERGFSAEVNEKEIGQIVLYEMFQLGQYILASHQNRTDTYKLRGLFRTVHNAEGVKRFLNESKTLGVLENSPANLCALWEYVEEQIYSPRDTPAKITPEETIRMTTPLAAGFIKSLVMSMRAFGEVHQTHILELIDLMNNLDNESSKKIQEQFVSAFRRSYTHPAQYQYGSIQQPQIWLESFCMIASHTLSEHIQKNKKSTESIKYSQREIYIALLLHMWYRENARVYASKMFPLHTRTVRQVPDDVKGIIENIKNGKPVEAREI